MLLTLDPRWQHISKDNRVSLSADLPFSLSLNCIICHFFVIPFFYSETSIESTDARKDNEVYATPWIKKHILNNVVV